MMTDLGNVEHSYSAEIARKGIHLFSLTIPVLYAFLSREVALAVLVPLMLFFLLTDLGRLFIPPFGRLYHRFFGWLLRKHEQNDRGRRLTGATYVLLSAVICVLFFPKLIVITAFAILIISDSAAALIGRRYGRHRFLAKSAEGSAAFFVTALLVVGLAPKISYLPAEYLIGAVGALVGTVVEGAGFGVDDNLSIPLSIGGVMWGLYFMFLPGINLFLLDLPR